MKAAGAQGVQELDPKSPEQKILQHPHDGCIFNQHPDRSPARQAHGNRGDFRKNRGRGAKGGRPLVPLLEMLYFSLRNVIDGGKNVVVSNKIA